MNADLEELASLYVLDQLPPRERTRFEARILQEPEVAALVRELESALARGVRSLPARVPRAGLLAEIEAQLEPARVTAFPPASGRRWAVLAGWGLAAVMVLSLGVLAVQSLRQRAGAPPLIVFVGLDANQSQFAEVPLQQATPDADARFMQLASLAESFWGKNAALPIPPAPAVAGDNRGYAVFDPASRQGFIAIEQLPALAANQRYHLWVADASTSRVWDAGVLPLAGLSRGLYSFAAGDPGATATSNRPRLFVTVEEIDAPHEAGAQPRGKVVLGRESI